MSLVDPGSGRGQGTVPVPPGTQQVVPGRVGRDEALLTLAAPAGALTHLRRSGPDGAWASRPVALEPAAVARLITGDGGRHAVAAYALRSARGGPAGTGLPPGPDRPGGRRRWSARCRCAPARATRCRPWPWRPARTGRSPTWRCGGRRRPARDRGGARLAAVHPQTGAVRASAPLPGVPEQLLLAPAPEGTPRRLYAVTAVPSAGASQDGAVGAGALAAEATEWRLTGLDPDTLHVESEQRLPHRPLWLGVTPDGRRAYAVAGPTSLLTPSVLLRIDLHAGSAALLRDAPGRVMGLAVTGDRLFLADPDGDGLWVMDHGGRLGRAIRVGRHPIALALGAP